MSSPGVFDLALRNSIRPEGAVSMRAACRFLRGWAPGARFGLAPPPVRAALLADDMLAHEPPPGAQARRPGPVPAGLVPAPGPAVVLEELARRCAQPSDLERADRLEEQ